MTTQSIPHRLVIEKISPEIAKITVIHTDKTQVSLCPPIEFVGGEIVRLLKLMK